VLKLTVCFLAFTPRYHCQTGSGPEPSTISVVLLFRTEVDVIWNLAIKHVPELIVCDDTTTHFLCSVRAGLEDRIQEAVRWDEKSVVLAWLKSEDLLADRACVQAILTPQAIQKLEVGGMEGKFGSRIDRRSALQRESGGKGGIKAQ
jgi:hypothetical protein